MSPYEIGILLHVHAIAQPLDSGFVETELRGRVIHDFLNEGLIREDEDSNSGYYTTDRGKALVEMLCNTPLPVQQWIDPRDNNVLRG